jgi:hypothetical protein
MSARTPEAEPLLTPAEVATMFRVDPKTVTRWAKATGVTGRPRFVLCSRVFRSSVPSSIPPWRHGPGGRRAFAPLAMQDGGARPEYWGSVPAGEGSFAQVITTGS